MKSDDSIREFSITLSHCIQRWSESSSAAAHITDQAFNDLALRLFQLQYLNNLPYQLLCQRRGINPKHVSLWQDIPSLSTQAFRELELTGLSPEERQWVFYSSGTTGQKPSRHWHSSSSLQLYETSLIPPFKNHLLVWDQDRTSSATSATRGPELQVPMIILTPPQNQAPHSSLVHMWATVRKLFGDATSVFTGRADTSGAWSLDLEATRSALARAERSNQSVFVLGTAFSLVHLTDHLLQNKAQIHLPPGSRILETGGYKGHSRTVPRQELHRLIIECLGVDASNVVCEYGMCELSSQAYDWVAAALIPAGVEPFSNQRVFQFPPWARGRVVSPETGREVDEGQTGWIQVFDLANAWSVLAVQTEDLAIRRGSGFELLGRATQAESRGCSLLQT
jgi:hypothetical protein